MKRKCIVCDEKGKKSIETKEDDFIKVGSSYAHTKCYEIKLMTNKKNRMNKSDAQIEINRIKDIMENEVNLENIKDEFFSVIKEYYKINLSSYFFMKVSEVVSGKNKKIATPISYTELLEMYSNDKMLRKLEKIAYKKNIKDPSERLFYDFGVMVNEYDNYKKSKNLKLHSTDESKKIIDDNNRLREFSKRNKNKQNNENEDEVDLKDLIL